MTSELIESRTSPAPAFDKEAYARFKLAMRFGEAISGCDDPPMVPASEATHMRPNDYVVGLVHRGKARAYPLWIVDNYHVVNDRIDGERIYFTSCERCQSGSAFVAEVAGNPERDPLFRSVGFVNATLLLKDLRSGSHWIHYEGKGLDRRAAGVLLPWIPTYHMEWRDWLALHPDTDVMAPTGEETHPDARHGHGREEIFGRAGMDPGFIPTILGDIDDTYPENEFVLGIADTDTDDAAIAFPLREVQRESGVVEAVSGGAPIVVLAGPKPDGFTMAAYDRRIGDRTLSFIRSNGGFRDTDTGSSWTIEGVASDGPLVGERLTPVRAFCVRWHAWAYFHRNTQIFYSTRERPRFVAGDPALEPFDSLLHALAEAGHDVVVGEPLVSQRRPHQSLTSVTVYVDGDRVNLHAFENDVAARDFHAFEASWAGYPLVAKSHWSKTKRVGRIVIESDPEQRFAEPTNIVPLPASTIRWAKVLDSDVIAELARASVPDENTAGAGFVEIVRALKLAGHDVIDMAFLTPGQLLPGVVNAIGLIIDADHFLLYRFDAPENAQRYASTIARAIAFGPYVMRSTPDSMYVHHAAEIIYASDETIRWSPLVEDAAFRRVLEGAVAGNDRSAKGDSRD